MIKVKDEEGKIVDLTSEDLGGAPQVAPKKKKKVTSKTVRSETVGTEATVADAEDTLAMIKQALKIGTGKLSDELLSIESGKPKKKKTVAKKKEKMPALESAEEVKETDQGVVEEDF